MTAIPNVLNCPIIDSRTRTQTGTTSARATLSIPEEKLLLLNLDYQRSCTVYSGSFLLISQIAYRLYY